MDLYMIPFTCSFAAHVSCIEAGLAHAVRYVDRQTKKLDDGRDYLTVTEKGTVPALGLPDGTLLTESAAVLQYIADVAPESRLAPRAGTRERYQLVEWLNFITTELHKKHLWMIFSSKTPEEAKTWARESIAGPLDVVARHLATRELLLGDDFTVADAYLFWCLFVAPHGGVSLERWPGLIAYAARIRERSSTKRAFAIEAPLYARQRAA